MHPIHRWAAALTTAFGLLALGACDQQRINELGRANTQMEVQLRADRAVPYGQVAELIGWVQAAGLNRIAFVAQAAASAP